jgi:FkbM family methyltransferase
MLDSQPSAVAQAKPLDQSDLAAEIEMYLARMQLLVSHDRSGASLNIPGHHALAWHRRKLYEEPVTLLLSFLIQRFRPQVFFDLGAAHGYFSRVAASHAHNAPVVHAFEMLPRLFLAMSADLAGDEHGGRVHAHLAAMSDRHEGERDVWFAGTKLFEHEPAKHECQQPWHQRVRFFFSGEDRDPVKARMLLTSIDEFAARHGVLPDLLKIDVEGYEGKVLRGGMQTFAQHRPLIALELHKDCRLRFGDKRRDVVSLLLDIGYKALFLTDHQDRKACRVVPVGADHPLIARQETDFLLFC